MTTCLERPPTSHPRHTYFTCLSWAYFCNVLARVTYGFHQKNLAYLASYIAYAKHWNETPWGRCKVDIVWTRMYAWTMEPTRLLAHKPSIKRSFCSQFWSQGLMWHMTVFCRSLATRLCKKYVWETGIHSVLRPWLHVQIWRETHGHFNCWRYNLCWAPCV